MLESKNIALFIDVDNCRLEYIHYENVINQLKECGNIVCATVYGANERKHKRIITDAHRNGYKIELPAVDRKRGVRAFDYRIFVDVSELVASNDKIDAVAIVAEPANMVHLYVMLKRHGVSIFSCDNADEYSMSYVDELIDTGKVEQLRVPSRHVIPPKKPIAKPETLKNMQESTAEQPVGVELPSNSDKIVAVDTPKIVADANGTEKISDAPSIADETQALLNKINAYRMEEKPENVTEKTTDERVADVDDKNSFSADNTTQFAPEPQVEVNQKVDEPVKVAPQNDSELFSKIEQAKQADDDDAELLARIQELLAELKK